VPLVGARRSIYVVAAYIERGGRVLLDRRSPGSHLAGRWEFPGGKREKGESDAEALRREMIEELGSDARIGDEIARVEHAYEDFDLTLVLYETSLVSEPRAAGVAEIAWFPWSELESLEMPPADRPLVHAVEARHLGRSTG
jgi:8-oxo-dGTP diphosphatase